MGFTANCIQSTNPKISGELVAMRSYKLAAFLIATTMAIFGTATMMSSKGQTKSRQKKQSAVVLRGPQQTAVPPTEEEILDQLPIADAVSPEISDPKQREKRRKKNARHDGQRTQPIVEAPYPITVTSFLHWAHKLPAIPVAESDVVILGEISDGRAYLSNDQTGIYSEFTISVEEVLKNDGDSLLIPGAEVQAERSGGAIKFPSGTMQRYVTVHQRMPLTGRRYLLFLERIKEGQDLRIITGYELRGQHVVPLDGASNPDTQLPFDIYKGADVSFFLDLARATIAERGASQ
jgi:hypothetical protein